MPCISGNFDPKVGPIVKIGIAKPVSLRPSAEASGEGKTAPIVAIPALVDTGASITCITEAVAKAAGLQLFGKRPTHSVHGEKLSNLYIGDVALPFGDPAKSNTVETLLKEASPLMEFVTNSSHYSALLGRDLLCEGLFTITGYDGRFTLCM